MHPVNALRYFEPLEPGGTPLSRPDDFWAAYASGLVAQASCGRMEIGQDVVSAAFEVMRSRPMTILSALHLARPPFPVTWLEWVMVPPAEIRRRGWLIVEHEPGTYKAILFGLESDDAIIVAGIGAILWSGTSPHEPDEAELEEASKALAETRSTSAAALDARSPDTFPGGEAEAKQYQRLLKDITAEDLVASRDLADLIELHSIEHGWFGDVIDLHDDAYPEADRLCRELVAVLLLLNSRNATETGTAPDLRAVNRARVRKGNPPLLPLCPVILDITRRLRAARRAGISATPSDIRAALVRGHFKARRSGVFWWSPHVRGSTGEISGRDYRVRAGR
jgi:hypothetical protein